MEQNWQEWNNTISSSILDWITCLVSSLSVYHYVERTAASCGLSCVAFAPLLRISALPLLRCRFPTKSFLSPSSCSQFRTRELKEQPAGTLRHRIIACITSVREKLNPPSHLARLGGDWLWHVWGRGVYGKVGGSGCSGPPAQTVTAGDQHPLAALQRRSCAEFQLIHQEAEGRRSRERLGNTAV